MENLGNYSQMGLLDMFLKFWNFKVIMTKSKDGVIQGHT